MTKMDGALFDNLLYHIHGPRLKQLWRGMGQARRERAMKSITHEYIPRNSQDLSTETMYRFVPEWNLTDITTAGSDFFLDILEHRATKSLNTQYCFGFGHGRGGSAFITEQIRTQDLRQVEIFPELYTFFLDGDSYGISIQILKDKENTLAMWEIAIDAGLYVPEPEGRLILERQFYLLTLLNVMVESLLSQLSIKPSITRLDISGALDSALDQKASLDDDLALIRTEPVVLAYLLDTWFFSRPELVTDEKGRRLPVRDYELIGCAFLDIIHDAVRGAAIWNYICRLLEVLETSVDTSHQHIILHEIIHVCHVEYSRLKAILKRQMSITIGACWFKRLSDSYEIGNARIALKGKPEVLARGDQQRHYLLRLCQAGTTALKAVDWLSKLGELHSKNPSLRSRLREGEIKALDDLAIIAIFIQSLSQAISLPTINRGRGQKFVAGAAELEIELSQVKPEIDLSDFAIPISNLLKPGIAEAALKALDGFIIKKTGTKIGFLYQDLIDDCITKLHEQLATQARHETAKNAAAATKSGYIPFPPETPKAPEARVHERRQKERTRPAHSSVYEIPSTDLEAVTAAAAPPPNPGSFKVKPVVAEVFSTLFSRAESRGSIPWANFEAALGELGFSVIPKSGSTYTFVPPETMAIQKPLTLHCPHKSRIEGYLLLVFARRLNRLYGWGEDTFQIA
ncbi:hypothetical protein F5B21DRAFT_525895 [Xylaria acuta]|nr:hypothetical protein F5B21DRAFT_525895 [Xylaria acuta]